MNGLDGITTDIDYMARKSANERYFLEAKDVPCTDCGLRWHPATITFDHIGRKGKYINAAGVPLQPNKMLTYNPTDFKNMIDACEAVCMNCHRIREMYRDKILNTEKWIKWYKQIDRGALLKATQSRKANND